MQEDIDYNKIVSIDEFEDEIENKIKGVVTLLDSLYISKESGYGEWDRHTCLVLSEMLSNVLIETEVVKENILYTNKLLLGE